MSAIIVRGIVRLSDRVPINDDVKKHPLKHGNVSINSKQNKSVNFMQLLPGKK